MAKTIDKKKLINIVVWSVIGVLLILILIPLASLAVQKFVNKEPVPKFLGYSYMVVLTPSMTGYADKGDVVVIKETDDLAVHDVVTYIDSRGDVVTHRITSINKETGIIKVKGDTNKDDDPIDLTIDDIEGKVVLVIPKVGLIFTWLVEEGGWVYLFAIIAVIGVGMYLLKTLKPNPGAEAESETPAEAKADEAAESTTAADGSEQITDDHSKDDNEK